MQSYRKFLNEIEVPIVRVGCREFKCIGAKPPQDHPHIYLNMGDVSEIVCPYCSTLFRFNVVFCLGESGAGPIRPLQPSISAPPVILQSTHEVALDAVDLADLKRRALELS